MDTKQSCTDLLCSELAILKLLASVGGYVVSQDGYWRVAYSLQSALEESERGRIRCPETIPNLIRHGFLRTTRENSKVWEINDTGRLAAAKQPSAP